MPVDVIVRIVLVPYLITRLSPDCSIVKLLVTNFGVDEAVAALPLIAIPHVPVAPVPSALGAPIEL